MGISQNFSSLVSGKISSEKDILIDEKYIYINVTTPHSSKWIGAQSRIYMDRGTPKKKKNRRHVTLTP